MNISTKVLIWFAIPLYCCSPKKQPVDEILSTFKHPEGFKLELVAMEPLVSDPVDMVIDEDGAVYVVEMHGYPLDVSGSGVVKRLYDDDGDGIFDRSQVFCDSLVLPTGIMKWKSGLLVTDPPDLLYLEDTDGDGRADKKEQVLTGFALSNPQHNFNNPEYGLDNWIYLANENAVKSKFFDDVLGDEGSEIRFVNQPNAPTLPKNGGDVNVKVDLINQRLELLSGDSQFGHTFSPWGDYFGTRNWSHIYHEAIPAQYIQRSKNLQLSSAMQYVPDYGIGFEIYPITKNPTHQLLTDVGAITSSCGITWYQGGQFPEPYEQVVFIAEPTHNLVHTDIMRPKGATFASSKQFQHREFLASTDGWFRPVNFYVGPDGSMYMLDYYRKIIEHPEWMSEEVVNSGELYEGADKGRIYRISFAGDKPANDSKSNSKSSSSDSKSNSNPSSSLQSGVQFTAGDPGAARSFSGGASLGQATENELIQYLGHPNIWWRRNAQRLIVSNQQETLIPHIKQYAESANPLGMTHALWTLEGLGHFDRELIKSALDHPVPGVRLNAIKISELHRVDFQGLEEILINLSADPDSKVRFQALCTLGYYESPLADQARREIMLQDIQDPWVQLAGLSALSVDALALFESSVQELSNKPSDGAKTLFTNIGRAIGREGDSDQLYSCLTTVLNQKSSGSNWWQVATMKGISEALHDQQLRIPASIAMRLSQNFNSKTDKELRTASVQLLQALGYFKQPSPLIEKARKTALDHSQDPDYRVDALKVLTWADADKFSGLFQEILISDQTGAVRKQAIASLQQTSGLAECEFLLAHWSGLTPQERDAAVNVCNSSDQRKQLFLQAIAADDIQSSVLGWGRTVRLLNSGNEAVRTLARQVLQGNETISDSVWQQYQEVLTLEGEALKGAEVFERSCALCHQISGTGGINYGPDLSAVQNRSKSGIMIDILKPNQSISDGYDLWTVEDEQGETYTGIVVGENPNTLTLRNASGEEQLIPRNSIKTRTASELSGMPEGLHHQITHQEMADLLEFLKGNR